MHPGNLRTPFDPAGPFVAQRRILVCGVWYDKDEWIPHTGVAERRLRQLYASRKIGMGTQHDVDLGLLVKKQEEKPKIVLPQNWRQMVNRDLFPLVKELLGVFPKNRAEAYELFGEIDGAP